MRLALLSASLCFLALGSLSDDPKSNNVLSPKELMRSLFRQYPDVKPEDLDKAAEYMNKGAEWDQTLTNGAVTIIHHWHKSKGVLSKAIRMLEQHELHPLPKRAPELLKALKQSSRKISAVVHRIQKIRNECSQKQSTCNLNLELTAQFLLSNDQVAHTELDISNALKPHEIDNDDDTNSIESTTPKLNDLFTLIKQFRRHNNKGLRQCAGVVNLSTQWVFEQVYEQESSVVVKQKVENMLRRRERNIFHAKKSTYDLRRRQKEEL